MKWVEELTQRQIHKSINLAQIRDNTQAEGSTQIPTRSHLNMDLTQRQIHRSTNPIQTERSIQIPRPYSHITHIPRSHTNVNNNEIAISEIHEQGGSTHNTEDIARFLSDDEIRLRMLNIRDNINVREVSQLYTKSKAKGKFKFEPRVILLRKRGNKNKIPKEGTPK